MAERIEINFETAGLNKMAADISERLQRMAQAMPYTLHAKQQMDIFICSERAQSWDFFGMVRDAPP
jgi:hypothetical protein